MVASNGNGSSQTRRWLRPLADRRVGTKIMLAVAIVAVFSVADGLFALVSLGATNSQVQTVYNHGMQLDAIGDLRAAVNETWLAADDYVLAATDADRATTKSALVAAGDEVTTTAARYKSYVLDPEAATEIAAFDTGWAEYTTLLQNQLLPLGARGDTVGLTALRTGDQAAVLTTIRTSLGALSDTTVSAAEAEEVRAESRYHTTRLWVIIMLAASAALGTALAAGIAQLIIRPLARCVRALTLIGQGDLTARVPV